MKPSRHAPLAGRLWNEWVRPLGTTALVIFAFRSAVADWNDVPTGSMQPSIMEGDRIWVDRLAYDFKVPFTTWHLAEWAAPSRGDVVVFHSPEDGIRLVKRVVGLPGDVVELKGNRLWLNGAAVDYGPLEDRYAGAIPENDRPHRRFAEEKLPGHSHPVMSMTDRGALRDFPPQVVPEGRYFMMGDSRDDSRDSRFFGTVARSAILGRATAVMASVDPDRHYAPRWSRWFTALP